MNHIAPAHAVDGYEFQGRPDTGLIPVVLSGGSGTRLWPVSREGFPKQFWALASENTLIQDTVLRASGEGFAPPLVVCNAEHRFLVAEQLRAAGVDGGRIVLEPVGRNSAPAVAVAALMAAKHDPGAIMWVMAADSSITRPESLLPALRAAIAAAKSGHIVTFGIRPAGPETGYGYIEAGAPLGGPGGACRVTRFVEKPTAETAKKLVDSGYLWNSGMFVFRAATMIEEMERYAPEVVSAARAAIEGSISDLTFVRLGEAFAACPDISLDYAVVERTERAAVVPADLGWSDVGSWKALWEISGKDSSGNVSVGDVVLEGTRDCYVRSDGILTAVTGLSDVVVVTTRDAVLVMHRDQAQDVKKIVDRLRREGRLEANSHKKVHRPWGFYEGLIQGERFQVKRIVVEPGQKLSLQKHFHRAEHWVVVSGTALVTRDDEIHMVRENESIYLPLGCVHRMENPGRIPLTLIEVQSGSYLGEDDIVRIEDTYGRG